MLGFMKQCHGLPPLLVVLICLACENREFHLRACADEPAIAAGAADTERAARLETMRELAGSVKMETHEGARRTPLELVPEPLLRYSDVPYGMRDATRWIWGTHGRPAALLKLELYPAGPIWSFAFTSVSAGLIAAECENEKSWLPIRRGFEPHPLPGAPVPAKTSVERLRQMRALARRFDGHRVYMPDNRRTQLRLLSQPLHRYDDAQVGLLDGAIFGLAKDTNPNIVLLIEALTAENPPTRWQYALVRHGDAEYHVELDGHEVWKTEGRAAVDPKEPYYWFHQPATLDVRPTKPPESE